jgi:type III secretory pathway lipoprotein EscJ
MRFLLVLLVACAPVVDGPAERRRAADHADATRLTAQLSALPGVVRAEVLLRRAAVDPLAPSPPTPASASLVIIVDDRADRAALAAAARALTRAAAPDVDPTILVEVGVTRPALADVGPFTVEAGSRAPLKAALAIALGLILVLASWIAYRERATSRRTR